jgi:hypothetical protein
MTDQYRMWIQQAFQEKKGGLFEKINEPATHSKSKNIRDLCGGIHEFKKGYQPRSNIVKEKNSDLLPDAHSAFNRLKNYFSQPLNYIRSVVLGR